MKKLLLLISILFVFVLASCSNTKNKTNNSTNEDNTNESQNSNSNNVNEDNIDQSQDSETENTNPIIVIYLSNNKTIKCELYPEIAPITVENFLNLVDSGFYNNTVFHRVIENFMIQTGGYYLDGYTICPKPSTSTIAGEFGSNGIENNILHEKGVLSMARANDKNSASSQFFICVETSPHLDNEYAAFGRVINDEGIEAAVEISKIPTIAVSYSLLNFPSEPVSITSIVRETTNE